MAYTFSTLEVKRWHWNCSEQQETIFECFKPINDTQDTTLLEPTVPTAKAWERNRSHRLIWNSWSAIGQLVTIIETSNALTYIWQHFYYYHCIITHHIRNFILRCDGTANIAHERRSGGVADEPHTDTHLDKAASGTGLPGREQRELTRAKRVWRPNRRRRKWILQCGGMVFLA